MANFTQNGTIAGDGTNILKRPNAARPRTNAHDAVDQKFGENGEMSKAWEERLSQLTKHGAYFLPHPEATKIYPWHTWTAVRAWGWNVVLTLITVAIIHGGLSYWTQPPGHILPELFLPTYISHIHRGKHGSDSGGYSPKGTFRKQVFDETFTSYDRDNKGGLTKRELLDAWVGQRVILDFFGWSAVAFEWFATYLLVWPEDGVLYKSDAEAVFDGSLFWKAKAKHDQRQRRLETRG